MLILNEWSLFGMMVIDIEIDNNFEIFEYLLNKKVVKEKKKSFSCIDVIGFVLR